MTTTTIYPAQIGCDYASSSGFRPDLFRSANVSFVHRYITTSASSWKVLTPAERDRFFALTAAGWPVALGLVWETSEKAILGGYAQGLADGKLAAVRATELRYPSSCAILAAVDTDVYAGNVQRCEAYLRGFFAGLAGRFRMGLYGDKDAYQCAADIIAVWCLPNAAGWNNGPIPYGLNIKQGRQNTVTDWDYPNIAGLPFTAWTGLGPDTAPPAELEQFPAPPPPIHQHPAAADFTPATFTKGAPAMFTLIRVRVPGTPVGSNPNDVQSNTCYAATFGGLFDSTQGIIPSMEWYGPGDDSPQGQRVQARLAAYRQRSIGVTIIELTDCPNISLAGAMPFGDSDPRTGAPFVWTDDNFGSRF